MIFWLWWGFELMLTLSQAQHKLADRWLEYRQDPVVFMTQVLDVRPHYVWSKMREVAESVRDHQFTAVPAGHSVSKTYNAARIAVWFKSCFNPSTVITTAPSDNQVSNQLWREIHTAYQGAKMRLGGHLTSLEWDCKPTPETLRRLVPEQRSLWEKNFAIGFATTPDTASDHATKMQGWHNQWLLVILDEACGIDAAIWKTVLDSLIVNPRCKVLALGNPTDLYSMFGTVCEPGSGWNVIRVSVRDTPNYQQGREVIPHIAGREFEARIIAEYGENSPEHKVRCLGIFPDLGGASVFGEGIFKFQQRHLRDDIQYGLFDYRTGDFMPSEQRRDCWQVLDLGGNHEHAIGVDTTEYRLSDVRDSQSERDYDAAVVLDRSNKQVKAIWHGRGAQIYLGEQVLGAARHYNQAWVVPEIPMAMGVLQVLRDNHYQNIYGRQANQSQYDVTDSDELGWRTTTVTRHWLVNDLLSSLRSDAIKAQFAEILDEMRTFCYDKTGKPIHMPGKHDDLIFGLGLALQGDLHCPRNLSLEIPERTGDEPASGRPEPSDYDLCASGAHDDIDAEEEDDDDGWYETV